MAVMLVLLDPFEIGRIIQFRALAAGLVPALDSDVFHPLVIQIAWLALLCVPLPLLLRSSVIGAPALCVLSALVVWTAGAALTLLWDKPPWGLTGAAVGIAAGHLIGALCARMLSIHPLGRRQWIRGLGRLYVRTLAVLAVLLATLALGGIPFFVIPEQDSISTAERADAVVVLGPAEPARILLAEQIAAADPGATMMVSSTKRDGRFVDPQCGRTEPYRVICFSAVPFTTAGEARAVEQRASAERWTQVVLVTALPHVSRARRVMEDCITPDVMVVSASAPRTPSDWAYAYIYQLIASAKQQLTGPC